MDFTTIARCALKSPLSVTKSLNEFSTLPRPSGFADVAACCVRLMITDLKPYRKYVDQFDLTDEQRLELVNALAMIVDKIYDIHLGVNQLSFNDKEGQKNIDKEVPPSSIEDEKFSLTIWRVSGDKMFK